MAADVFDTFQRRPLVLASSRTVPDVRPDIAAGTHPRLDYLALADALGGDVLGSQVADALPAWRRRLERALSSDIRQAQIAWQRRGLCDVWLSTSEKVGLPLALHRLAARRSPAPAHVMIAHNLDSARKRQIHRLTGVLRGGFHSIICLSSTQETFLRDEIGLPPQRVHRLLHNVDTQFYQPGREDAEGKYILAVGRENRDYPTLIAAARETGLPLTLVASSLWAMRGGAVAEDDLPANVTVRRDFVPYTSLRELYAGARLVVVPLRACSYAAGSTGLLEAMAMGKPTIVTRTEGLADYLVERGTHRSVPPGDAAALAAALRSLWGDAPARRALAHAGREWAERYASQDHYVARVAQIVRQAVEKKVL